MSVRPVPLRLAALVATACAAAIAACSATYSLPPAAFATDTATVTLWALTGTPLALPSAYSMLDYPPIVVRTDRSSAFDFAFDIQVDSTHDTSAVLLPRGAVGLTIDGGLQITQQPYDSITFAPNSGYQDSLPVKVAVGTVVLAASRSETCNFSYVYPLYGKIRVTAIDLVARSVTFNILVDPDCGYRSLKADSLPPKQ
jgi:hypothetical protein